MRRPVSATASILATGTGLRRKAAVGTALAHGGRRLVPARLVAELVLGQPAKGRLEPARVQVVVRHTAQRRKRVQELVAIGGEEPDHPRNGCGRKGDEVLRPRLDAEELRQQHGEPLGGDAPQQPVHGPDGELVF